MYPIINPCEEDPEELLEYNQLRMIPCSTLVDSTIPNRTIRELHLNRPQVIINRGELLVEIEQYVEDLNQKILELEACNPGRQYNNKLSQIRDSLDTIFNLTHNNKNYAGFIRYHIRENQIIQEATLLIA